MQFACAVLSSVACRALQYFTTLSHKLNDLKKKERKRLFACKMCVLFPPRLLSETFLILRRSERDVIKNVHRSSCKVPIHFSCQILINLNFLDGFFAEKYSNIKFHENPSIGSRVVPCGQT
jgi:hypothetical protein